MTFMASSSSWVATTGGPLPLPTTITTTTLPGTDRKKEIGEYLIRGREMADKLRAILRETRDDHDIISSTTTTTYDDIHHDHDYYSSVLPAQGLVGQILDTFTQSLLLLTGGTHVAIESGDHEVSQVPVVVDSPSRKSEDSEESCKKPRAKDRRGCYKRRQTSETWTKETPTCFDDGHAWRKYGQKVILHADHPRNYYRCTHKYDQGCQAKKQVQKVQDDPPLFRTTYHGHHKCSSPNLLKSSTHHIIIDAVTNDPNATIWSFQSHDPVLEPEHKPHCNNTTPGSVINSTNPTTAGIKRKIRSSSSSQSPTPAVADHRHHDGDYFISALAADHHHLSVDTAFPTGSDSDVYSCTASPHSTMDQMDHMSMVDGVLFEDFNFSSIFR